MEKQEENYQMSKQEKAVANRLARIIGHIKAVKTMVENERDCSEVLIQLAAIKSAINNAGKVLLQDYIAESVEEIIAEKEERNPERQKEKKQEMDKVIDMFIK